MSESLNIYHKLNIIQVKLNAPKSQINSFSNYNYRNCEDILQALKPLLKELKCVILLSDKITFINDRFYLEATAKIIDCETKEDISAIAYAREIEDKKKFDASQLTGSASSYARKYALSGLLAIDDIKDSDNQDNSSKDNKDNKDNKNIKLANEYQKKVTIPDNGKSQPENLQTINPKQVGLLKYKIQSKQISDIDVNNMLNKYGIENIKLADKLKSNELNEILKHIESL